MYSGTYKRRGTFLNTDDLGAAVLALKARPCFVEVLCHCQHHHSACRITVQDVKPDAIVMCSYSEDAAFILNELEKNTVYTPV